MPDEDEDRCTICGNEPEHEVDTEDGPCCFHCVGYDCVACDREIQRPDDMSPEFIDNIHRQCEPDTEEEEHELGLERFD